MTDTSIKSYTQAGMNEAAQEAARECIFENSEKDYLVCCSKPESECRTESKPNFNRASEQELFYEFIPLVVILLVVFSGLYFVIKKRLYKKLLPPYQLELKAILYGWIIWGLCVFSYAKLFDEYVEYGIWLSLPPLCAIAIYFWFRSFVLKSSNKTN